jgi:ESCRT-I complex subunit VPS28
MEIEFTQEEKEIFDNEAIIYSIIRTVEVLEKAHVSDKISEEDYNSLCRKLIGQYKTMVESLEGSYPGLDQFMQKYGLTTSCKMSYKRLLLGITALDTQATEVDRPKTSFIIAATQSFITANNALQLEMRSVDKLIPILQDVVSNLGKVPGVPASYQGGKSMQDWLLRLSRMNVYDELSPEQAQQLEFDIDQAYRGFKDCMGA